MTTQGNFKKSDHDSYLILRELKNEGELTHPRAIKNYKRLVETRKRYLAEHTYTAKGLAKLERLKKRGKLKGWANVLLKPWRKEEKSAHVEAEKVAKEKRALLKAAYDQFPKRSSREEKEAELFRLLKDGDPATPIAVGSKEHKLMCAIRKSVKRANPSKTKGRKLVQDKEVGMEE